MRIPPQLHTAVSAIALSCTLFCTASAHAYKISYKGISPFVDDFPAAHENNTSEAWQHFCSAYPNISPLREAPLVGLMSSAYYSCDELVFSPSASDFVENIERSPLAGVLLGARYPDLRELTGLDANKQNAVVVNYRDEAQFDAYRISPLSHGQLSKFHNVFGGDQELGLRKYREFIRATLFESRALLLSNTAHVPHENWFVASSHMWNHDAELSEEGLWHNVPWVQIITGAAFHAIEDSYSHDPLIIFDEENNRVVRGSLFYGRFKNNSGHVVDMKGVYPSIHHEIEASMHAFSHVPPILFRPEGDALNVADLPAYVEYEGQSVPLYYEAHGKRFASGYAVGGISVAAVSEYMSTLYFMLENTHDAEMVNAVVEQYLDKYFSWDLYAVPGFSPNVTYAYAHDDNARANLAWSNFEQVDLWSQSFLDDRVVDGKTALILPWTERDSMPDILHDPAIEERIVVAAGEAESFDSQIKIFTAAPKTLYVFHSWNDLTGDNVSRIPLNDGDFFSRTSQGVQVQEVEFDIDGGFRGLDQVKAFAWVPAGYQLCMHLPANGSGHTYGPRLALYDTARERYRCFYGGDSGRIAHLNFHIPKTTRLSVLPIDSDQDGVPFLRGVNDDMYSDACPLDANESEDSTACAEDNLPAPEPQYHIVTTDFHGGSGGAVFDDSSYLNVDWQTQSLMIRSGDRVDAIQFSYTNGQNIRHGGNGGQEHRLDLQEGEFVTALEFSVGRNFWGVRRVHSVRLETNLGRVLAGGKVRSEKYRYTAPAGGQIVGLVGRAGAEVDALGVVIRQPL